MIIKELNLGHFGKFQNKKITLSPGINVIYGKNEAGKSTIHSFIRGMLFGMEKSRGRSSKEEAYTRYEPWDAPGDYQGSMIIQMEETEYRITRSFYKKQKYIQVVNLSTGREYPADEHKLRELLHGLSEDIYKNTVSMEQLKAKTEQELARELKNYITNLATSKSTEVDVPAALKFLADGKKQLEKKLPTEEITELSAQLSKDQTELNQIQEKEEELKRINAEIEHCRLKLSRFDDAITREKKNKILFFPAICEKYKSYCEIKQHIEDLKERLEVLKEKMKRYPGEMDDGELIKQHLTELEELRIKKQKYEEEIRKKKSEWEEESKKKRFDVKIAAIVMVVFGIILCIIPVGNSIIRCFAGIGICAVGILQYMYIANKEGHIQGKHDEVERQYERKIFKLHSLRHDLLLVHRVTNETQLAIKHADISKCETERKEMAERQKEYLKTMQSLEIKKEALEQEILNFMKYFMIDPELNDCCMQEVKMLITEFKDDFLKEEEACKEQMMALKSQADKLHWFLESAGDVQTRWEEDESKKKELIQEKNKVEEEILAIDLSIDTLKNLSACIHDTFGARLNESVSELIEKISEGEYREVIIDENLAIKVLKNNRYIPIEQLSTGTIHQIYLALRLAVGRLLVPQGNLPIVLDDCFAYYDDERMGCALKLLQKQAPVQVIIFSCHKREIKFFKENGIDVNIIEL